MRVTITEHITSVSVALPLISITFQFPLKWANTSPQIPIKPPQLFLSIHVSHCPPWSQKYDSCLRWRKIYLSSWQCRHIEVWGLKIQVACGSLASTWGFPRCRPVQHRKRDFFMLMLVKKPPIRSVSHTSNLSHSWGCVPQQGGLKTCHRLIRGRLPRTFTADTIRQAGQILKQHVNSMELLIGRIKEKLLLTMSRWKRKVCVCVCVD